MCADWPRRRASDSTAAWGWAFAWRQRAEPSCWRTVAELRDCRQPLAFRIWKDLGDFDLPGVSENWLCFQRIW